MKYNCIVVLGPTACGKTRLACSLAYHLNGEIISADSRQVYKRLNIGTGKDLEEYTVSGKSIPYHLIDLVEPGEQFYLHEFMARLESAFREITARQHLPIICGGTGLYLDALRKDFSLTQVKENPSLREKLEPLDKEELLRRLRAFPEELYAHVDIQSKKRIIRGIEVATYRANAEPLPQKEAIPYRPFYLGISLPLDERKRRISERLEKRLKNGLIEEAEGLLKAGLTHGRLEALGLEYKFVSCYLRGQLNRETLFIRLQTAIFQFSKRQMTWYRKMEKEGVEIHWLDADDIPENAVSRVKNAFSKG